MTHHHIAAALRDLRVTHGYTQRELAARCGIGEKTISSYETGERAIALRVEDLRHILDVYSVPMWKFFFELAHGRKTW